MHILAAGFWGAFFGTAALMLVLALAAFVRSQRRVALAATVTPLMSALFVAGYLGWLPLAQDTEARLLAHLAVGAALVLDLQLLSMLGLLREPAAARRLVPVLPAVSVLMLAAGWLLPPRQALALGSLTAFAMSFAMLLVAVRCARNGHRYARAATLALSCVLVALAGLIWIALDRGAPWPVHAVSAVAASAYLAATAAALWARYSYLLELAEVLAHGPAYDPVTRMRSHGETTGQLAGSVFLRGGESARPVGVIVVCIANLYALESLHGRAAFNHALFVCAGRLRRSVPAGVEMGRLGDDGFLLLVRTARDMNRVVDIARALREQLVRPVVLSARRDPAGLERADVRWVAEIGIGVLGTSTLVRPAQAISTARAMARTAWSYASRLACYDQEAECIAELPLTGAAPPGPA